MADLVGRGHTPRGRRGTGPRPVAFLLGGSRGPIVSESAERRVPHPPPAVSAAALAVHRGLVEAGEESLLAGGAVRDLLLGVKPTDFDLATSAPPERVAELFPRTVLVGAQFGVARVLVDEEEVEVATFRADLEYRDGRRPVAVRYTNAREDAIRRDFTINGLFYDLEREEVVDHVGGLDDLAAGLIRAIGDPDRRFGEDRLRLLRAIRFSVSLGFPIEAATWEAILRHAAAVKDVSAERVRDELERMLVHPSRAEALRLLSRAELLRPLLPEVADMHGVAQPPEYHPEGDVFEHTALVLSHLEEPSFPLALGALLHDIGKPPTFEVADRIRFNRHDALGARMAEEVCERLRLSKRERDEVVFLVQRHLAFIAIDEMRPSRRTRLFDEEHFESLLALCYADCRGSHGDTSLPERAEEHYRAYLAAGPRREPILRGRELMKIGYLPGPRLGEILRAVEDARRDGELEGDETEPAIEWVRARYPLADERGEGGEP